MLESIDGYRIDIKWALRFLGLASYISKWSKDPSTKVGAVIAQGNRIVSLGYNGFPAGIADSSYRLEDRDTKLDIVIHAEENAILFARRSLVGCTLFVNRIPCPRCMAKIIQTGISSVFYEENVEFENRYENEVILTKELAREASVAMFKLSDGVIVNA